MRKSITLPLEVPAAMKFLESVLETLSVFSSELIGREKLESIFLSFKEMKSTVPESVIAYKTSLYSSIPIASGCLFVNTFFELSSEVCFSLAPNHNG
jgi:hypothetical protein